MRDARGTGACGRVGDRARDAVGADAAAGGSAAAGPGRADLRLSAAGLCRAASTSPWEAHKHRLAALARQQGVREATIQAVIPALQINSRVMELDRAQRPTSYSNYVQNYRPYLDRHITTSLINRGQSRYSAHWTNLSRIQSLYGVDPAVIMAIYGKETSYGSVTGGFDLVEALATLAYEGRRRSMFEQEFVAALKLIDQGVQRWQLSGSYAGATGYPQFMPSVALRLRADGDGDGYADIWRNEDDAFASIANYLRDAGWKRNVPWGVPVQIPATLNRAAIQSRLTPPRCPAVYRRHSRWLTVARVARARCRCRPAAACRTPSWRR